MMTTEINSKMHADFVSMLPCGMVVPFNQAIRKYLEENTGLFEKFQVELEGNVNHENSYYPQLEKVKTLEELPDILVASDINHLFHQPFREQFIQEKIFQEFLPWGRNPELDQHVFFDPQGNFTMISANLLVIVVHHHQLKGRPIPQSWEDLLSSDFRHSIALRGDNQFFCNGVLLPFYQRWGITAIQALAQNTCQALHPAQMAKLAGSGLQQEPVISVMPYFFYDKIQRKENVSLIWPREGAIPSPVFMLLKKNISRSHQQLAHFLVSEEMAHLFSHRGFPHCHPQGTIDTPQKKFFWVGWDFLNHADVGKAKSEIQQVFQQYYSGCDL